MTIYNFIFNGHEYTINDRAGNQGKCPHCGKVASDGFFYSEFEDKDTFIGYYEINKDEVTLCFECLGCFKKFYFHMPKTSWVREYLQAEKKVTLLNKRSEK